jgi:uncharacterized protein (TIGR02757 family)
MNFLELKDFLDLKVEQYNNTDFIASDPIQIPHLFTKKQDIEIAGFLSATIAWGNRKMIIKNGLRIVELFDYAPHDFILNHSPKDLKSIENFVHRTFNQEDLLCCISQLNQLYNQHESLENVFFSAPEKDLQYNISLFKILFFNGKTNSRSVKHISDPQKGSAAKRLNMFLRWMVRQDTNGVDFGIWQKIKPSDLSCPLDVHSGNVARKLGLLTRTQNDAKALFELDSNLRLLDKNDPVKYDFALFGLGVFEKF